MGVPKFLKRKRKTDTGIAGAPKHISPTPETMFELNTMASQWIKEGSFAEHGFESPVDLVAAFTISEMVGASSELTDKDIIESLTPMFDINPDRCAFLIQQARLSIPKP